MKILLVYPLYPDSFWSFKHALKFISKKAAVPPLGLITVSAMLPREWQKKLVDLNVSELETADIKWADYVFISAMYIQKKSVKDIMLKCKEQGTKMVAGGPLFTQEYNNYPIIDHFVLNEAEITLPLFLDDLLNGTPAKVYKTDQFANLSLSPIPDFSLLQMKKYVFMNIQVSRGCPFSCDFCEITSLLGHKVRMKDSDQIIKELDELYRLKWRGSVSIVDDNFIGNKSEIKSNLLPSIKRWMQSHKYPFVFNIQSSIDLADDTELMSLMVETGLTSTFIGIETPDEESLHACHKVQNKNRNLLQSVKNIQNNGLQVSGGFIIGFDSDTPSVFQRQVEFIQKSGIVSAMVGLLNAPKNTKLYKRLETEKRLTTEASGNNTDSSMNFIPKMDYGELIRGYKQIIRNIYAPEPYYHRVRQMFVNYQQNSKMAKRINFSLISAFLKSMYIIGILNKGRIEFWKLLFWTLFKKPGLFADAITFAVYGYHFRTVYGLREKQECK
ncbi:B12-binding domain-containing radical SAM protein [Marinilabilia rubra]|uniref:B12-binding domain-containing radical SAM protein n=1 Tax=Marinilabilia rubra TaxID=2162893 RepID=A0A2U2B5F6_9BACT|nr:B12-binding domain-containing radical SAM protein [Marinilabilia rubra]PWD98297.1 B12-binding domain-containing radical SAM protein [Marinilabilia rubra]